MATVLALEETLAANVIEHLTDGTVIPYRPNLDDVPYNAIESEGPRRLVEFCAEHRPRVAVVGVRLGGNRYPAMEGVRGMLALSDRPAVVLVVGHITHALAKHAWEIGVYSIVETERPDRDRLSRIIADEVVLARAWREGRGERVSFLSLAPVRPRRRVSGHRRRVAKSS